MHSLLIRWLLNALALVATAALVPGIIVENYFSALIAALVLGLINIFIKPILLLLTLPINMFTLGLFTLVINGLMLELVSAIVKGFNITGGFGSAILGALVLSIISFVLNLVAPN